MNDINFGGYFPETFNFFDGLSKHNSKKWFDKHRTHYDDYVLEPSKDFVLTIKQFFNFVNPKIVCEPKFNKSFVRINKDMRFAKKPYKDYFLIRFGKEKWASEFFLVLNKEEISAGLFINNEKKEESIFTGNLINHSDEFLEYSKKYKIDRKYDLIELMKMEQLVKGFRAERDTSRLLEQKYLLLRKSFTKDKNIIYTKKFFIDIFKIYNQLYPYYLFATSDNLKSELKEYDEKVGMISFGK